MLEVDHRASQEWQEERWEAESYLHLPHMLTGTFDIFATIRKPLSCLILPSNACETLMTRSEVSVVPSGSCIGRETISAVSDTLLPPSTEAVLIAKMDATWNTNWPPRTFHTGFSPTSSAWSSLDKRPATGDMVCAGGTVVVVVELDGAATAVEVEPVC